MPFRKMVLAELHGVDEVGEGQGGRQGGRGVGSYIGSTMGRLGD